MKNSSMVNINLQNQMRSNLTYIYDLDLLGYVSKEVFFCFLIEEMYALLYTTLIVKRLTKRGKLDEKSTYYRGRSCWSNSCL